MRLRKAVLPKPSNLLEYPIGELSWMSPCEHAVNKLLFKFLKPSTLIRLGTWGLLASSSYHEYDTYRG